jgi:hypothetical protein
MANPFLPFYFLLLPCFPPFVGIIRIRFLGSPLILDFGFGILDRKNPVAIAPGSDNPQSAI